MHGPRERVAVVVPGVFDSTDTKAHAHWYYRCLAPLGPVANITYPPGTCVTSSAQTAGETILAAWSRMQPGVEWVTGALMNMETAQVMEDASAYQGMGHAHGWGGVGRGVGG